MLDGVAIASGFLISAGLILAIGPQNAYVFRQGLRKQYVFSVCTVCFVSDASLITMGVLGAAQVFALNPTVRTVMTWAGITFIAGYGLLSLYQAYRAKAHLLDDANTLPAPERAGALAAMTTVLALTWLNPHVYVDTMVLIGGVAATYEAGWVRLSFGIGAIVASALWFYGIGYGAGMLRPLFQSARAWRLLDLVIGLVMLLIAGLLARSVMS